MQNIPSEDKMVGFRQCFRASSKDSILVVADYSQQESRILAELAEEDTLISFFNSGKGDLHSYTANLMFKVPVSKKENPHLRQLAKILNFGIAYGMSAHKLSNDFNVSLEEAEQFIENFYATYPKLKSYFHKVQTEALFTGKILINRFTNHRHLADSVYRKYQEAKGVIDASRNSSRKVEKTVWKQFFVSKGEIERKSQNYPIQGSGALMSKLAAILFNRAVKANKLDATLINMVHDELVVETKKEIAEQVLALLVQCMEDAGKVFIKKLPIEASGKISEFWAH